MDIDAAWKTKATPNTCQHCRKTRHWAKECDLCFNVRYMDTDKIERELENKFAAKDVASVETLDEAEPPVSVEDFCIPQRVSRAPPLLSNNQISVLEITKPKIDEDAQEPNTPALPPTEPRKPRWPKWEKRIKDKLVIRSLELDAKCIMLLIHLKRRWTLWKRHP